MIEIIRGRVTAANKDQALREMESRLWKSGYELAGEYSLRPCPIQPWEDVIWSIDPTPEGGGLREQS